jgi:hypothetical protein
MVAPDPTPVRGFYYFSISSISEGFAAPPGLFRQRSVPAFPQGGTGAKLLFALPFFAAHRAGLRASRASHATPPPPILYFSSI